MNNEHKLVIKAHEIIDLSISSGADILAPLFSGGHDSLSAVYVSSKHPKFTGLVYHIDTSIGSKATQEFVRDVAKTFHWDLKILKSPYTYERFVREYGFPGPGVHQWAYNRLKERCINQILREHKKLKVALITGCRVQESARRMGTVEPLKIGEHNKSGKVLNKRRFWTAPCYNWSQQEQAEFMEYYDLPKNPLKLTPIGMSGECFCGAFARPAEIDLIKKYAPDVAEEIVRLTQIAKDCGKPSTWGTRPDRKKGIVVVETGPLCNSCDARALSAGLIIKQNCGD